MMQIKRTQQEVDKLLDACHDQENKGGSKFRGMSYEQGIATGIEWLLGDVEENPLD